MGELLLDALNLIKTFDIHQTTTKSEGLVKVSLGHDSWEND